MTDVASPQPTVGAILRAMRKAVNRGHGAGADTLREWTTGLLTQLFGKQKAVLWQEFDGSTGGWIQLYYSNQVQRAMRERRVIRALYTHPKPPDTSKNHRWPPNDGPCLDCGCHSDFPTDVCRPEDKPGYKPPSKPQRFSPAAYREPLQVLNDLATTRLPLSYRDARHWQQQTAFLLEGIKTEQKEQRT